MLTEETVLVESRLGADYIEVRRDADGYTWLAPRCRGRWRVVNKHHPSDERIFCGRCGHRHPAGWVS